MDRIRSHAARASAAALVLAALTAASPSVAARDHLGWRRDAAGQLVMHEMPRGAPLESSSMPGAGDLQRLPMPDPPGETAFDRALAREREAVTRQRAKHRAALEARAESLRRVVDRNRAEAAAAEAKRRAPRAERVGSAKKRAHGKHASANRSTHRAPPEPEPADGDSDDPS